MDKPINVVDQLLPLIAEAVEDWRKNNSTANLKERVKKLLDNNSQEVTLKLLGFKNNWGRWELDHCNGRSGESAAGDFIRNTQSEAVNEWLATVCLPELDAKTKAKFKKEANTLYRECILRGLRKTVEQRAQEDLDKLLKVLTTSEQIDNYIKTMELIS